MSVEDVARECQVTLLRARLAQLREYDEPFRILDPHPRTRIRLFKHCKRLVFNAPASGAFTTWGLDRYAAVNLLRRLYRRAHDKLLTVALVDPATGPHLVEPADSLVTLGSDDGASAPLDLVDWARAIQDVVRQVQHSGALDHR